MADAEGALALLILLDQIPRNVFRGSAHAWAADPLARHYASRALDAGFDQQVDADLRLFFYMPFEHSESLADQERSVALHRTLPGKDADAWAVKHYDVIAKFGRFPHRNAALGRSARRRNRRISMRVAGSAKARSSFVARISEAHPGHGMSGFGSAVRRAGQSRPGHA